MAYSLITLRKLWFYAFFIPMLGGCAMIGRNTDFIEGVLLPGASVTATDTATAVKVTAVGKLRRQIVVGTSDVELNLRPRGTRWLGSLGGYMPNRDFTINNGNFDGWSLGLIESQLHFYGWNHFDSWLRIAPAFTEFYYDDGIMLRLALFSKRNEVVIELYRVTIGGVAAPWSHDSAGEVKGRLVDIRIPESADNFHSRPPTLEELERQYEERDPFEVFEE